MKKTYMEVCKYKLQYMSIVLIIILSILLGTIIAVDNRIAIYTVICISVVILLLNFDLSYFLFISLIPIEFLLKDNFSLIIKGFGIILFISFIINKHRNFRYIHINKSIFCLILFLTWATISIFWSGDKKTAIQFLVSFILLTTLYFMIINQNVDVLRTINLSFSALTVGGIALVCTGFYQIFTETYRIPGLGRINGGTNDQNYYFILCICLFPALYWMYTTTRRKLMKLVYILLSMALIISSLYTKSRAGLASLLVFIFLTLVLQKKKKKAILISLAIIMIIISIMPTDFIDRFGNIKYDELNRLTLIWPSAIQNILKSPVIGYGIGNGAIQMRNTTSIPAYYDFNSLSSHNLYFGIILDVGIIGLTLFLGAIIIPLRDSYLLGKRIVRKNSKFYPVLTILFSAITSYLFFSFASGGMETRKILWILLGVLILVFNAAKKDSLKVDSSND